MALSVLVVALTGLLGVVFYGGRLREAYREQVRAQTAARSVLEMMRAERLEEVYARYNDDPADDPGGSGTGHGSAFPVEGLVSPAGRPAGRIFFPEAGTPPTLREDVADPAFDMPAGKDLNGDGRIDSDSRARDYQLLPVRIVVEWQGKGKGRRLEVAALLTRK